MSALSLTDQWAYQNFNLEGIYERDMASLRAKLEKAIASDDGDQIDYLEEAIAYSEQEYQKAQQERLEGWYQLCAKYDVGEAPTIFSLGTERSSVSGGLTLFAGADYQPVPLERPAPSKCAPPKFYGGDDDEDEDEENSIVVDRRKPLGDATNSPQPKKAAPEKKAEPKVDSEEEDDESEPMSLDSEEENDDEDEVMPQPKKRGPPPVVLELDNDGAPRVVLELDDDEEEVKPAPKKKKSDVLVKLALALKYGNRSTLVLSCLGVLDRRWDQKTVTTISRVPLSMGYPPGTEKTTVGNSMFRNGTPNEHDVYTFEKIVYEPGKRGKNTKKTGEEVYYRLVEESDVEAIKKAFPHLVF